MARCACPSAGWTLHQAGGMAQTIAHARQRARWPLMRSWNGRNAVAHHAIEPGRESWDSDAQKYMSACRREDGD